MSALSFARNAFNREKPHSSITAWVDILTANTIAEEAYDGIPELVDSINLQSSGPAEVSRALRKKLKHGSSHQQYRALVLLKALVENGGHKFQTSFADSQLTDALKSIASDSSADRRVRKKLLFVLSSWHDQFKDDPSMGLVAGLYKSCKGPTSPDTAFFSTSSEKNEGKLEAKRAAREQEAADKARQLGQDQSARKAKGEVEKKKKLLKMNRMPFDFEKDKPNVLSSIVDASQASNNLVNAITLVNPQIDNIQTHKRVQEFLLKAKQSRRIIVRYIQLVENEELIGTLIETNERIISALAMYDKFSGQGSKVPEANSEITDVSQDNAESELTKLQEKQRAAVERVKQQTSGNESEEPEPESFMHPDLQDLTFGPLGASSSGLLPPMRPSRLSMSDARRPIHDYLDARGSLSDYSDYESSDEESHHVGPASRMRDDRVPGAKTSQELVNHDGLQEDDPFADPFADEASASTHPVKDL